MKRIADDFAAIRGAVLSPVAAADPVQRLARRWEAAQQKASNATDGPTAVAAFEQIKAVEEEIFALPQSSLALVSLKLRVLAMWMAVEDGDYQDGVRTDPLDFHEQMLASALADLERLTGAAT